MATDETKTEELSQFLETGEQVLYTGRAHTGSIIRASLWMLAPLLGWWLNKKEPLQTWRLAITDRRVMLSEGRSKERSFRFDQLAGLELVRASGINRTLLVRTPEGEETKVGLPSARNDYTKLEEALAQAAPRLMGS